MVGEPLPKLPGIKNAGSAGGALASLPTPTDTTELATLHRALYQALSSLASVVDLHALGLQRVLERGDTGGIIPPKEAKRLAKEATEPLREIAVDLWNQATAARHNYPVMMHLYAEALETRPDRGRPRGRGFNFED